MTHIKNVGKGILKEFPFARGILEEYDSEKIQKLDKHFHEDKIQTIESLIEAINNLNPNKGRKVTIKEILHVPKQYSYDAKKSDARNHYKEYFDADKLKVEIKEEDDSNLFIAFLVRLTFHNDDRDTTIHHVTLTAFTEDKKTTTIPDMIKLDDGKWEKFDIDELARKINKNTSKKIFFRFISRDFLVDSEILVKLTLDHTSGDFEVVSSSKFIENIDDIKWAKRSSGGSGFSIISL